MSWEGYYQYICKNGHSFNGDGYETDIATATCPVCQVKAKWYNVVDQTNGTFGADGKTRIDGYADLKVAKAAEISTCQHCGMTKILKQATYAIPKDKGHLVAPYVRAINKRQKELEKIRQQRRKQQR